MAAPDYLVLFPCFQTLSGTANEVGLVATVTVIFYDHILQLLYSTYMPSSFVPAALYQISGNHKLVFSPKNGPNRRLGLS